MGRRQFHLSFGSAMMILGLIGIYYQLFNVIDVMTAVVNIGLILIGLVVVASGVVKANTNKVVTGIGCVLVVIGLYGLYDEWSATVDVFRGLSPLFLIVIGIISLISGIRVLNSQMVKGSDL